MQQRPLCLRAAAYLPVLMSLTALAIVLTYLNRHGPAPQPDEGAAAHIWQILMVAQAPIVGFFALRWVPAAPRTAAPILAIQVAAALAALAPVYLLGW